MRAVAWSLAIAACAAPTATNQPLANRSTSPAAPQILRTLVVDEAQTCSPYRVTITVDGAAVATVAVTCPPPPPPTPGVVVVVSDIARKFDGPPITFTPGTHIIGARDDRTGHSATRTTSIPAYGSDPHARRLADSIVVADDADGVRILVDIRALLIFL
ncbi:MAG TPA: hypothetical protein VGG74_20220 [Kofleriaceae bacterium]|jgi:hypothetical protein